MINKDEIKMTCQKYEVFIDQEFECYIQVTTDKVINPTLLINLGDSRAIFEITSNSSVYYGKPIPTTLQHPTVFSTDYEALNNEFFLQYGVVKQIDILAVESGDIIIDVSKKNQNLSYQYNLLMN
jgi:5'(3')-deoxyribonucleotidase